MASVSELLRLVITGDGQGAISEFRRVGTSARTELGSAEAAARGFGQTTSTALIAGGAAAAAAGGGLLLALKKTSDAYVEAGRGVLQLQRVTGGSAEDMSRLKFAAQQSGIGVDQLATGLVRLSKNAEAGGAKTLAQFGVAVKDAGGNTRPTIDILKDIATRFETIPGGIEKTRAAVAVFGRAGADLLPLLNRGADGIDALAKQADALGLTLGQKDVDGIKQYTAAQRELSASWQALQVNLGKSVFPAVSEALKQVSGTVSGAAKAFAGLPPELQKVIGQGALLGSSILVAGGALSVIIGLGGRVASTFGGAAGGVGKFATSMRAVTTEGQGVRAALNGVEGGLSGGQVGFAAATVAVIGFTTAWAEMQRQTEKNVAQFAPNTGDLAKAFDTKDVQAQQVELAKLAVEIGKPRDVGTLNAGDSIKNFFGIYDDAGSKAKVVDETIKRLGDTITSLNVPADQARSTLDQLGIIMVRSGVSAGEVTAKLQPLYDALNQKSKVDSTRDSIDGFSSSAEGAGTAADGASAQLEKLAIGFSVVQTKADEAKPALTRNADALKGAFDPVLGLIDANRAYADSQKKLAEIASGTTPGLISATKNLADAQQRLNDVLKDDPLFGLASVSAESQIADARNRLADANARLAANPKDALAQTARDQAIGDLDRGEKRRQDDVRNAAQRNKQIRDAQNQVASAQQNVNEEKSKTGVASDEYAKASEDVVRNNIKVQEADAILAQYIKDHGVAAIGEINAKLDEWIAKGGPLGAAASQIKGQLQPLVDQAQAWADALGSASENLNGLIALTQQLNKSTPTGLQVLQRQGRAGPETFTAPQPKTRNLEPNEIIGAGGPLGNLLKPVNDFGNYLASFLPFAKGGYVSGGTPGKDSVPAMLMPGEFVLTADTVNKVGLGRLQQLNGSGNFDPGGSSVPAPMRPPAAIPAPTVNVSPTVAASNQEPVVMNTTIIQHTTMPETSGAAVVEALRGIAFRAGRGMKVPV